MDKEIFINNVLIEVENKFDASQLRKLKMVLVIQLRDYQLEKHRNELIIYDETSDIAAYKQYFVSKKIQGLSPRSLIQYKYAIDRFMRRVKKPFCEVTTNDIRLYLADRSMMDKLSNASLRRERGAIVRFFKWLFQEEFIKKDPGARVEMIKVEKRLKEPFSEMEIEKIRASCISTKETAIVELLMSTMCRVSELCLLHSDKLNERTGSVTIIGKGDKERTVYINAKAQVALMAYWYDFGISDGYLIQGRHLGNPITTSGIQKIVKEIGRRAGVENVHPHRFRRTAATFALRRGMELARIMRSLGHESMDTTLMYAIVSDTDVANDHKKYVT